MVEAVRVATLQDLTAIERLLSLAIASTPTARAGSLYRQQEREQVASARLVWALETPDAEVLVSTIDDYIAGFALITRSSSVADVQELFVEPEARGVSLGELLLDGCVQWARAQECTGIDLDALPGDRDLKNLCERSGFSARVLVMHRPL